MEMDKSVLMAVGEEAAEKYREYRKGNWTLNETMVLIKAKKMDYERRRSRDGSSAGCSVGSSRPQEMRWKWVEDFCWRHGCYRSQNQCNDRWDNLMRDYKKVRAYETTSTPNPSYWNLERHDRKERSLPSNLLPEIYEALTEVVQMRSMAAAASASAYAAGPLEEEKQQVAPGSPPSIPPPPPPPPPPPHPPHPPSIDSEDSQRSISPERKRKRGEGSSTHRGDTTELTSAISKCASIMAEALEAGEQREAMRHKDHIAIETRKAELEASKSQMSVQSMDGLATAINKLASSILGLVTDRVQKLQK